MEGKGYRLLGYVRREDQLVTAEWRGETILVERKCTTCIHWELEFDHQPCKGCNEKHTPENPYHDWKFDPEYDPELDKF